MPGPFPGMDPYLEHPISWQETHNALITYIRSALNRVLPSPYVATMETRCYIGDAGDQILPDLTVIEQARPRMHPVGSGGRAITAEVPATTAIGIDPSLTFRVYPPEEIHEIFVNVINKAQNGRVVTTLELLSHTNKTARNRGRELYLEKQQEMLVSHTHLIEIDLLRFGHYTVAMPQERFQPEHEYDYLVCLHRAGRGKEYTVWLNALRQRLPCIAIPLDADVADVGLDLQAVFDRNYEEGAYARKVDYSQEPVPPLTAKDALWADKLLREYGV